MCGLVGCAGNLNGKHDRILKQLLMVDSLRGEDSTGVAGVTKFNGDVLVAKQLGNPFELFNYKPFETVLSRANRALIGHNRYATSGGVSKATAHPFEFDTLVGVHNGTLNSKHKLLDHTQFKVDSENLYHHIENNGLEDAISKLGGYGNAWALVWWDKVAQTLNFLRNNERTLYYTLSDDAQTLFWASEAWMLTAVLARNDVKHLDIRLFETDLLHTIHIDDKGTLHKPVVRKVAAPTYQNFEKKNVMQLVHERKEKAKEESVYAGKKLSDVYSGEYLRRRQVVLELLDPVTDSRGATFMPCFDKENPMFDIRLYVHRTDMICQLAGEEITGDITGYMHVGSSGYYKVSPHTWKMHFEDIEDTPVTYKTHTGASVTKEEWDKMYQNCAWCSSPLNAEDSNKFSGGGDCFCPSCAKDDLVTSNVNLLH